jgi:hypothetical protein
VPAYPTALGERMLEAGFRVEYTSYFNLVGRLDGG